MEKKKTKHSLWYKDAIIYQVHVRAFADSNGDGIGDFKGLISKLDYIKNLGVNTIWLLPFYPSPLKDGGYDISDFTGIHEDYGKLADFKRLIREAHKRDLRVITELVLNHTSNQHQWFERARNAKPTSKWRDYYVWSDTPDKYNDARIIFQDFELSNWSWDPVAESYYWHRFYNHQPDLNYDNPKVQQAVFRVLDFWFNTGVDGLRLDAVPYLVEREGTNCENLPETHEFLKKLRAYIDENHENKMLLAEANQWPDDAIAYFGNGDECHMAFHFPLMPRLFMGLKMEDRFPITDILEQTPEIPESSQWAIFLRNHDELTLEMVTDEERDYMYKSFVNNPEQRINLGIRRRLAPLMENDRRKIELMNVLLFSLPGTPIIYYGDEIGMGDNYYLGDRDGVRTPMQWSSDRNEGFSKTNPQKLYLPTIIEPEYHFESINVESQDHNPSSLLWWMRRMIAHRKRFKAFSRGGIQFVDSNNHRVLSFIREYQDETVLVLINISKESQSVDLDLEDYVGHVPKDIFSMNEFPKIEKSPYTFSLQFYDYFWFTLEKEKEAEEINNEMDKTYEMAISLNDWKRMTPKLIHVLQGKMLANYISNARWFRSKTRKIRKLHIIDRLFLNQGEDFSSHLLFVELEYHSGEPEIYLLPISFAIEEDALERLNEYPGQIIAKLQIDKHDGIIYESTVDKKFHDILFNVLKNKNKLKSKFKGEVSSSQGKILKQFIHQKKEYESSQILGVEQSNSSILYKNEFFLKIYRKLEELDNPEIDILRFLTEKTKFNNIPLYAGGIEYNHPKVKTMTIGILTEFISNEGDAWDFTGRFVEQYFGNVLSKKDELKSILAMPKSLLDEFDEEVTEKMNDLADHFFIEMIEKLGQRTAELHLALATPTTNPDFKAEPFSLLYQKSLNQAIRTSVKRNLSLLKANKRKIPVEFKEDVDILIKQENTILTYIKKGLEKKIGSQKTRVHGDYHLGQVLYTGKDFLIIDFEGEPSKSIGARKLKYCPLKDVSGMLRSFHYAIYNGFFRQTRIRPEDIETFQPWIEPWYKHVAHVFLKSYLETAGKAKFIPDKQEDIELLMNLFIVDKAVYEIGYELNNRPDWISIPMQGLKYILQNTEKEK